MALSVNPYSSYSYSPLHSIGKSSAGMLFPYGSQSANSSFFAKYVLHSKPYEQYIKTAAAGIANFLRSAQDMQDAAQKLLQKTDSPFQARTVKSSDAGKVAATASAGAAIKTYDVKVHALAASQKNSGTLLSGSDASVVGQGLNEFNITIGGKTTKVSAIIDANDTNDQALTKLKNAINAAKTGVTASIVTDGQTGKKRLELRSDKTGTDHAFQVEDAAGNAMAATGVTNATQQAANASYSVNGGPVRTSQSNTIELEPGKVTATLLAVTDEDARLEVRPDSARIIAEVKDLVTSYNAMYKRLREADGIMNASVRRSLDAIVDSATYERIGIIRNGDGTLRLDEQQLEKSLSANFDWTAKAIGGNLGLADRLSSAAARFNEVPASSLLNHKARQVQQFALYQASLQLVMPPQTSGWMFNLFY